MRSRWSNEEKGDRLPVCQNDNALVEMFRKTPGLRPGWTAIPADGTISIAGRSAVVVM